MSRIIKHSRENVNWIITLAMKAFRTGLYSLPIPTIVFNQPWLEQMSTFISSNTLTSTSHGVRPWNIRFRTEVGGSQKNLRCINHPLLDSLLPSTRGYHPLDTVKKKMASNLFSSFRCNDTVLFLCISAHFPHIPLLPHQKEYNGNSICGGKKIVYTLLGCPLENANTYPCNFCKPTAHKWALGICTGMITSIYKFSCV